ncbi:MAG TPA: glycosyltransferase, partial [Flavisolibacter sp.]|nr:glycosyltransferase [Flavisolibacter sp.]
YSDLPIVYYKNQPALGTPANWNFAISKASGQWIKLMHDDDWFADKNSLEYFAEEAKKGKHFIFSGYTNIFDTGGKVKWHFPFLWKDRIVNAPLTLMARNVIGPPSVTMVHHSIKERYDTLMKWRVDIDFYIRALQKERAYSMIDKSLINVGIGVSQVTNDCFNIPEVELPEAFLMIKKYGLSPLRNVIVYDAWWRMLRNMEIRTEEQLVKYSPYGQWPVAIVHIVRHEARVPVGLLKVRVLSKFFMFVSYLLNRKYLRN